MFRTMKLFTTMAALAAVVPAGARAQHAMGDEPAGAPAAAALDVNAVARDIAAVRGVTASFRSFADARAAGWSTRITGCMMDPHGAGGMGFHFGKPALIDATVQADEPEVLIYEPEAHGRIRLVAVEYIIPVDQWHDSLPPRLFGRAFTVNEQFKVWALHAWVWKDNPNGMFAPYNPRVTCQGADVALPAEAM